MKFNLHKIHVGMLAGLDYLLPYFVFFDFSTKKFNIISGKCFYMIHYLDHLANSNT